MRAMLLRLLLALVIAMLPMPAAGAADCHATSADITMAMPGHDGHQAPAKAPPRERMASMLCMGCVAPVTVLPPMLAARLPLRHVPPAVRALTGDPLGAVPPALPPPRANG